MSTCRTKKGTHRYTGRPTILQIPIKHFYEDTRDMKTQTRNYDQNYLTNLACELTSVGSIHCKDTVW
eukprot:scaffold6555_cov182-Amphora_coffeaeformis.AAC.3